jgi:hypothetical protein
MKLVPAFRAQARYVDLLRRNSDGNQLPAIGFGQVQGGLTFQIIALRKPSSKVSGNFGAHLEAAGADGWSDGSVHFGQIRAHGQESFRRDFLHCPAPTRMHRGDPAAAGVNQQHREAIGRFHGNQGPRRFGDEGIALADPAAGSVYAHGDVGVDLVQSRNVFRVARVTGAEAMFQPREPFERFGAVNAVVCLIEH